MCLTVDMHLQWQFQTPPWFLSGRTCKTAGCSNTYFPHCKYLMLKHVFLLINRGHVGLSENGQCLYSSCRMSDIITKRQRAPWLWPDWIYNMLQEGKEHSRRLKILHSFTKSVSDHPLFSVNVWDFRFNM